MVLSFIETQECGSNLVKGMSLLLFVSLLVNPNLFAGDLHEQTRTLSQPEPPSSVSGYALELIKGSDSALLGRSNPGSDGNQYGYECGSVFLYRGEYHMFITEMLTGWDLTRCGHWKSADGLSWKRIGTVLKSIDRPANPRHAVWSPMPVFNQIQQRWNIFFVGYERNGSYHGSVFRACSKQKGYNELEGPYRILKGAVLSFKDASKNSWESSQGADSFYPYNSNGTYYGFYGSSDAATHWDVGLARAAHLAGPWRRVTRQTPVFTFCENPIVTTLPDGVKFCVFDDLAHSITRCHSIGYGYSTNGIDWVQKYLSVPMPPWAICIRTPLSFIPEGNHAYMIYFTAWTRSGQARFEKVGRMKVRLIRKQVPSPGPAVNDGKLGNQMSAAEGFLSNVTGVK